MTIYHDNGIYFLIENKTFGGTPGLGADLNIIFSSESVQHLPIIGFLASFPAGKAQNS